MEPTLVAELSGGSDMAFDGAEPEPAVDTVHWTTMVGTGTVGDVPRYGFIPRYGTD